MMGENDLITQDVGRKCADDVADAVRRNMHLMLNQRGVMIVAAYGAAAAIGAANGAFASYMGGGNEIDEALVDQLWSEILRPMILGNLAEDHPHA